MFFGIVSVLCIISAILFAVRVRRRSEGVEKVAIISICIGIISAISSVLIVSLIDFLFYPMRAGGEAVSDGTSGAANLGAFYIISCLAIIVATLIVCGAFLKRAFRIYVLLFCVALVSSVTAVAVRSQIAADQNYGP